MSLVFLKNHILRILGAVLLTTPFLSSYSYAYDLGTFDDKPGKDYSNQSEQNKFGNSFLKKTWTPIATRLEGRSLGQNPLTRLLGERVYERESFRSWLLSSSAAATPSAIKLIHFSQNETVLISRSSERVSLLELLSVNFLAVDIRF